MDRDGVLDLCSAMPGAIEDAPFGNDVAVFKIGGKMFALVLLTGDPARLNLKCDPDWALELRAQYAAVTPGYHTNKRHWNTVELDGSVPDIDIQDMIDHSYDLVVSGLPKKVRATLPVSPATVVRRFNHAISLADLDALASLMTDDHVFVDSAGTRIEGRSACLDAWKGFFSAFPDYQNVFEHQVQHDGEVVVAGRSTCSDPVLDGPAIWRAVIDDGRVSLWEVNEDTRAQRRRLGLDP